MTQREENKHKMYHGLILVCDPAKPITLVLPKFGESYDAFTGCVKRLDKLALRSAEKTDGITLNKRQLRVSMCELGAEIAGSVATYGTKTGNLELAGKVNYSYSDLFGGRGVASADSCQIVLDAAKQNVAALGPFGTTPEKLTDFEQRIGAYRGVVEKPRNARKTGKTVTEQIKKEFETADNILAEELDKLVLQFKNSAPQFFADYQNARIIVDDAATHDTGDATTPSPQPKVA